MHENKVQTCLTLSVKKLEKKNKIRPQRKYLKVKMKFKFDRDHGTANFNRDHHYNFFYQ